MADISKLTLPINGTATTYNIADSTARDAFTLLDSTVQSLQETTFLTYKDSTHTEAQIKAITNAKIGDFYIASDTGTAWVCTKVTATSATWEKAGSSADVSAFVTAVDAGAITDTVPQTFEGHQVSEFVLKTDVVNNLTSTATDVPLSAAQGKALNDKLTTTTTTASNAMPQSGGTLTGALVAQSNTNYTTKQVRNVVLSTAEPTSSDGANGDIWIKYES